MKKEPKCTKVYILKWEAPWGAARAERAQRGGAERADAGG